MGEALVIVDFQNDFTPGDVARALDAVRAAGGEAR